MALRFFSSLAERVEAPCQVVAGGAEGDEGEERGLTELHGFLGRHGGRCPVRSRTLCTRVPS